MARSTARLHGAAASLELAGPPVIPFACGKIDVSGRRAFFVHRCDEQVAAPEVLIADASNLGISGVVQPHRSHHGHPRLAGLPRKCVVVGQQLIPQFDVFLGDRFDGGVVQFRLRRGVASFPGPASLSPHVQGRRFSHPRPGPHQRIERGKLHPAHIQFARVFIRRIKRTDVGVPEGRDAQRVVDANGDMGFQGPPRRERIARPHPAAPTRDAQIAVAMQAPGAHVGLLRERARVVEFMALHALVEVEPVALVGPPRIHPGIDQRIVLVPVVLNVGVVELLTGLGRNGSLRSFLDDHDPMGSYASSP